MHSLTLSPPHPLTLLYIFHSFPFQSFPFFTSLIFYPFTSFTSFFTSLIFYPFTFKNSFFPLPFYLFTLLIFIFSPSCSFSLIVKKYLFSVIFIPISLFCFHKSINFAEVQLKYGTFLPIWRYYSILLNVLLNITSTTLKNRLRKEGINLKIKLFSFSLQRMPQTYPAAYMHTHSDG